MFENTGRFTDRSSNDGYSCPQIHLRFYGCIVNRGFERSMFHRYERTFDDLAAVSLGIFPHAMEQQHAHFHWQDSS
ncbi:hypothetical protein TNCV_4616251 [Trichonephila clavipes]|nr:hypothetical protein TNCV_4616251 [Trichonephila clavipes]